MKSLSLLAVMLITLLFANACDNQQAQRQTQKELMLEQVKSSDEQALIKAELIEPSWQEIRHFGYPQKEQALAEYSEALDSLDLKIEILEKKVATQDPEISHNIKEGWKEDMENLRRRRDKLSDDYHKLELATPENWERTLASFYTEWDNLQNRWEGIRAE